MSTNVSAGQSEEADRLPQRRLPFWVALALSVALLGPTTHWWLAVFALSALSPLLVALAVAGL